MVETLSDRVADADPLSKEEGVVEELKITDFEQIKFI